MFYLTRFLQKRISGWYWGYIFQGIVILGILPILLPLFLNLSLPASKIGMIVGTVYLGQLSGPLIGSWASRKNSYKLFFLSGYILIGISFCLFLVTSGFLSWLFFAFLIGVGSVATNTIGGMYIVEIFPKKQWDRRIGWMQTYYGAGQAFGVFLMVYLQKMPNTAMFICALFMAPGLLLSYFLTPRLGKTKPNPTPAKAPALVRHAQPALAHYHKPLASTIGKWKKKWLSLFTLHLLSWMLLMIGSWMIYNLYPLLMKNSYHILPQKSSLIFAIGATIGIAAYPLSGALAKKIGDNWTLFIGFLLSVLASFALAFFAYFPHFPPALFFVTLSVILITTAWSPLIVGGTALTAKLAVVKEGEAIGLFNSATAIASIIGAFIAGHVAEFLSYNYITFLAFIIILASQILFIPLLFKKKNKKLFSKKAKTS